MNSVTEKLKEAKLVRALDKIKIIIQHNQGANTSNFDYQFNLEQGKKFSQFDPIILSIREIVDQETLNQVNKDKS